MLLEVANNNLRRRVAVIGIVLIVAPSLVLLLATWAVLQRINYNAEIAGPPEANASVTQLRQNLIEVCQRFHEDTFDKLASGRTILNAMGAIDLDRNRVLDWRATNEATGETLEVRLPVMRAGAVDLLPVTEFTAPAPVVDEIATTAGTPATIFQRMNASGDMLRICSSLKARGGMRAIGSYVPATDKALQEVLAGRTYINYLTSYQPLTDRVGNIVGMLYTALGENQVTNKVRELAAHNANGERGELFAFRATGKNRGTALLIGDKSLEGRDLWNEKDSSGQPYVQAICLRALRLSAGEVAEYKYLKTNRLGGVPRVMVAQFAYDSSLDWVVGFAQAETDSQAAATWAMWLLCGVAVAACGFAVQIWLRFSDDLADRLSAILAGLNRDAQTMSAAALALFEGEPETSSMARTTDDLRNLGDRVRAMEVTSAQPDDTAVEQQALNLMRLSENLGQKVAEFSTDVGLEAEKPGDQRGS